MEIERNNPQLRNIKIKTHNAEQISSLPEEIIEEILSRLPVKSHLKFRCVSKSWCSLIGSKQFIKTHLQNSTKNTSFTHHRIISSFSPSNPCLFKHFSLRSLLNQPVCDSFVFDCPINYPHDSIRLVGSCDGLICILIGKKDFFLWNPSTRMSKKLPAFDEWSPGFIPTYGFGYDESNDDYKVVGILFSGCKYQLVGKVYSLKTNSWKIMKDIDGAYGAGKLVSGKLHWGRKLALNSKWDIVSFDMKSEVHGIVQHPNYVDDNFYASVGVLGGCLCVLCDYPKNRLDVWVLKQYGVKDSWDKVATIPYLRSRISFRETDNCWNVQFSTPLCIGPQGEILFKRESTFVIYYPKDNKLCRPWIKNFYKFHEANVYIESLVSLVPDGEQER